MGKSKAQQQPCKKHAWTPCSGYFSNEFKEGMRCGKCQLYRQFTIDERAIYKLGHHFGRIATLNKVQSLFSVCVRQAQEERE